MKILLAVLLSAAVWPNVAKANLQFCNHTGKSVDVAIAYVERDAPGTSTGGDKGVTAEGWWGIEPHGCAVVSQMNAARYEIFFYAQSKDSVWGRESLLCIPKGVAFTIGTRFLQQGERCRANRKEYGFRSMNATTKNFTENLYHGN
jgi:uncharacterized membrane protein